MGGRAGVTALLAGDDAEKWDEIPAVAVGGVERLEVPPAAAAAMAMACCLTSLDRLTKASLERISSSSLHSCEQ